MIWLQQERERHSYDLPYDEKQAQAAVDDFYALQE